MKRRKSDRQTYRQTDTDTQAHTEQTGTHIRTDRQRDKETKGQLQR